MKKKLLLAILSILLIGGVHKRDGSFCVRDVFDGFVESEDMWGTKIYVDQANWSVLS